MLKEFKETPSDGQTINRKIITLAVRKFNWIRAHSSRSTRKAHLKLQERINELKKEIEGLQKDHKKNHQPGITAHPLGSPARAAAQAAGDSIIQQISTYQAQLVVFTLELKTFKLDELPYYEDLMKRFNDFHLAMKNKLTENQKKIELVDRELQVKQTFWELDVSK